MSAGEGARKLEGGFRLGDFEVYPMRLELVRGDKVVRLEFKVMAVLLYLAERADEVVPREDILKRVWPRTVNEEVLNRAIALLRSALDDDAHEPKYIMTIPRVGYRLIAAVRPLHEPPVEPPVQEPPVPPPPRRPWPIVVLGALALSIIVAIAVWPKLDRNRYAVLRFINLPTDANPYFGDGLTTEIQNALARVTGISVVGQQSVFMVDPHDDPHEIGRRLNAGAIIVGTVRRDGDRLRITVALIDANTGLEEWSDAYEFHMSDTFEIQKQISQSILERHFKPGPSPDSAAERPADVVAWTLFLRANQALRNRDFPRAIDLYQRAIARDPKFGRAYAELAEAYILQPSYTGSSEKAGHALAIDAENRAEALGEDPSHASGMRAYMQFRTRQWRAARDTFEIALNALPNNAEVLQWYSQFLASVGRIEDAKREAKAAVEADPLWPAANQRAGFLNIWSNRADAERYFETAAEGSLSGLPEARLAYLLTAGRVDEARTVLLATQAARKQSTDWIEPAIAAVTRTAPRDPAIDALQRDYRAGTLGVSMYFGALFMIGDADAVYAALPDIIANGEPFDVEVFFSDSDNGRVLRTDPRFADWMQRLGLVDFWDATKWPDKCARTAGNITCR